MPENNGQSHIEKQLHTFFQQRQEAALEYIHLMDLIEDDLLQGDTERLDVHSAAEGEALSRLQAVQRAINALREEHPTGVRGEGREPAGDPVKASNNPEDHGVLMENLFQELNETAVQKLHRNRRRLGALLQATGDEIARVRRARAKTGRKFSPPHSFYIDIQR